MSSQEEINARIQEQLARTDADRATLEAMSTGELKLRHGAVSALIKLAQAGDGKEWQALIPQQRLINEVLVARLAAERAAASEPEPDAVVIGLNPAPLSVARQPVRAVVAGASADASPVSKVLSQSGSVTFICRCGQTLTVTITNEQVPGMVTCGGCGLTFAAQFMLFVRKPASKEVSAGG